MTDREKEIRDAERKALTEVRRWRRNTGKRLWAMTPEERQKHWDEFHKEIIAEGWFEAVSSPQ